MERLTLADVTKRVGPGDGPHMKIAEILSRTSPLIQDAPWIPTNKSDTRTVSLRAGLPSSDRRRANRPVKLSKSKTTQVEEATTTRESFSEPDKLVIDSFQDPATARASESAAFIEGMAQDFEGDLWYGNRDSDVDNVVGLANRYNSLSGNIRQNVLSMGGTGADNASVYLIAWGTNKVSLIYPRHAEGMSKGAVTHKNLGEGVFQGTDADGNQVRMEVYRDKFCISGGPCIFDWRCVVRIANIDISDLKTAAEGMTSKLRFFMARALHRIPMVDGMARFYMNRTVAENLDIERLAQVGNAGMTYREVDGMLVPHFRNVPIRIDDNLLITEDVVA